MNKNDTADTALRAWFESWLSVPVCYFFYMPMPGYGHLMRAIVALLCRARLILLARHGPDPKSVSSVNRAEEPARDTQMPDATGTEGLMLDLLDRLAARFDAARMEMSTAHGVEWKNDFLAQVSWKLRIRKLRIEKWVEIIGAERRGEAHGATEPREPDPSAADPDAVKNDGLEAVDGDAEAMWQDPLEALLRGDDGQECWLWSSALFQGTELDSGDFDAAESRNSAA